MKLYKKLNESVNYQYFEEGIFRWLGRNFIYKPVRWAGRKISNRAIRKFSRSDPNDYNAVKGGYFTSDSDLDSLNIRIINSELGKYLERDPNGKVRFNNLKLKSLQTKDPEMYAQIINLRTAIAKNNNSSWFMLSRGRRNAIEDALSNLELAAIKKGNLDHPLNDDVLSLVSKKDPDIVRKYFTINQAFQNLSKSGNLGVAGNRDRLLQKRKDQLAKVAAEILGKDFDIRHNPSKYTKRDSERTSDVNVALNKKIRSNR